MRTRVFTTVVLLILSESIFSQGACPKQTIESSIVRKPADGMIVSATCTTLVVKWKGDLDQTYLVSGTYINPTTFEKGKLLVITEDNCDNQFNCTATIPVKPNTNVSWSVQAVQLVDDRTLFSYVFHGEQDYVLPDCNTDKTPVARAGRDQIVIYPYSTVLDGTASNAARGYFLTNYQWSKLSGGRHNFVTPNGPGTWLNSLEVGEYVFRLSVTDNKGASDSAEVKVLVKDPRTPPTARVGPNQTVLFPYSTVLDGRASSAVPGSTIVRYQWSKVSGPRHNFVSPESPATWLNSLELGEYKFRLTITDNNGNTSSADMLVTVVSTLPRTMVGNTMNSQTDNIAGNKLATYPSPAGSLVTLDWNHEYKGDAEITFLDVSGKEVKVLAIKKAGNHYKDKISISELKQGLYYIVIKMGNGKVLSTRFLKN